MKGYTALFTLALALLACTPPPPAPATAPPSCQVLPTPPRGEADYDGASELWTLYDGTVYGWSHEEDSPILPTPLCF